MGLQRHVRTLVIVAGTAALTTASPAIARTVVRFATNAERVDGFSAVGAGASADRRAGKLVATDESGRLPNGIIARAPDSKKLGMIPADEYTQICQDGTIDGLARVSADVGSSWTEVDGYGYSVPATPVPSPIPSGANSQACSYFSAKVSPSARRVSAGHYVVSFGSVCRSSGMPPPPLSVTVNSSLELVGTATTICDTNDRGEEQEVTIGTPSGTPTDADFTLLTFEPALSPCLPQPGCQP